MSAQAKESVRLRERTFLDSQMKVDAENGVLRGVKLLGLASRNGRRYESQALANARELYEGRKVYVDHPDRDFDGNDRKFNDWAGVIENVSYRDSDGLYGDVALRKESSHFKGIIEAASNPKFHKSCGFSHVAEGESRFDDDLEIVESIREVFSVDLVTDPATTAGFFESYRRPAIKEDLQKVLKSLPEGEQKKKLVEMVDAYGLPPDMAEEKPADPMSEFASIAKELIRMLGEALVAKNTAPPPAPPAAETDPASEEDEEMTPEEKEKIEAFESVTQENKRLKAGKLLLESGRAATDARMKALANCETDEEAQELLESWPRIEETARPGSSPPAMGAITDFPRGDSKKFAAMLR